MAKLGLFAFASQLCLFFSRGLAAPFAPPNSSSIPSRIWDTSPGETWTDGYPIGNGRLGAMFPGSATSDTITVNEDSLWSGPLLHRVNPDAFSSVKVMQEQVRQGYFEQAQVLGSLGYIGTPVSTRHYEPLGSMSLAQNISGTVSNYERWLDLADGAAGVYFASSQVFYQREYLASNPQDVIAVHLTASEPGSISFTVRLDRGTSLNRWESYSQPVNGDTTIMGVSSDGNSGISFAAGATVSASGGKVDTIGDYVRCSGADEATIYFSAWTSFRKTDPREAVLSDLAAASRQSYEQIRAAHVADFTEYMGRVELDLGTSTKEQKSMTTPERMIAISPTNFDPELAALYFQFGRYCLISTSRAGTLPPNLQGIWSQDLDPMWGSKYTININLQMNYWPSLTTGLADLVSPLHELLKAMREKGTLVAKTMYNCSGMVTHHNTDLWGDSAPQDIWSPSTFWPMGATWLVTHVIEYFRFTGDKSTLVDMLNVLEATAQFGLDFVTPYKEWMLTNPSLSPENIYIAPGTTNQQVSVTLGPTIDNSLLWELWGFLIEAHGELGLSDADFVGQLANMREKLPPLRLNQYDGIAEWIEDFEEALPGISHMSHLWGLYPGSQITPSNQTTFNAAKASLNHRLNNGGGACGWSRAWTVALAGRLFLPEIVHEYYTTQLSSCTFNTSLLNQGAPAPFQIDGNFGTPAGLVEALLQSHEFVSTANNSSLTAAYTGALNKVPLIRLLPALPPQWAANGGGSVSGLQARGGFTIDISWTSQGELEHANITSHLGNDAYVTVGSAVIGSSNSSNATVISIPGSGSPPSGFIRLSSEKNVTYDVIPA